MRTTLGQRLMVIWLVLSGAFTLLYAAFLPVPLVSEQTVPAFWWAVGGVTLVAAVGVWRRAAWGRVLAILVVTFLAVWGVWGQAHFSWDVGDLSLWLADWRWLNPAISIAFASLALWWLVKRWVPPGVQSP
jgi:hypothetical protein